MVVIVVVVVMEGFFSQPAMLSPDGPKTQACSCAGGGPFQSVS